MNPWLVLSRDGVLTEELLPGRASADAWQPLSGSLEALARLTSAGFKVVLAFNQSAIGRGLLNQPELEALHRRLRRQAERLGGTIEGIFYCPHLPEDQCDCRKPRTGLLNKIEQTFAISLADSWCVGDSLKDIQAAKAHGLKPVLLRTGKGAQTEVAILISPKYKKSTLIFDDLGDFADYILEH